MSLKQKLHSAIRSSGWYVRRRRNLPVGIDWPLDLKRRIPGFKPSVVFDVGANVGQTSLWLHREFPGAAIHAFEPVEETYATLVEATRGFSAIECHRTAFGSEKGSARIAVVAGGTRNSIVTGLFNDHAGAHDADIEIDTVDAFCRKRGIEKIDILKTDTEGFDDSVLKGAHQMMSLGRVSVVVAEVSFDPRNTLQTSFFAVFETLLEAGFLPCAFYEAETLFRVSPAGTFCNALFVRKDLLGNRS